MDFIFLTKLCESKWPVLAHTQSGSAGIHCLILTDTSPTAPLLPHKCCQGHDESSKNKMDTGGKKNWWKCCFFWCSTPSPPTKPPPARSMHCHRHRFSLNRQFLTKPCTFTTNQQNDWVAHFYPSPTGKWAPFCCGHDKINCHIQEGSSPSSLYFTP